MRTYIVILFVLLFAFSCSSSNIREVPGSELITDQEFKKDLLEYLALDEKLDYENIYNYKSKGYLKRHFPNIKNAKEYSDEMKNTSERMPSEYLKIVRWNKLNDGKYGVELVSKTLCEGILTEITEIFYFVNEDGKWKFNGLEQIDSKSIEE